MNDGSKRWIKIGAALGVAFGLLAAGWIWGRPAYQGLKEKHLATEAAANFERGDYRNAAMSARLTLMLNASNLIACRIMADLAEMSHAPAALDWRQRVAEIEPAATNRLALAVTAITFQSPPFPLATEILDDLGNTSATNLTAYHSVATMLALRENQPALAEAHMAAALALEPTNRNFVLNLAVLQLGSTNAIVAATARRTLETFCTDSNLGPGALRSLISDRLMHANPAEALKYSEQLLATHPPGFADELQQLGILKNLNDPSLKSHLIAVQKQAATNVLLVAQMADWMQANDQGAASAAWIQSLPAAMQSHPAVQAALANYYLSTAKWTELCRLTAKGDWQEMDFLRTAFLARAWDGLGEPLVASSQWRSAIDKTVGKLGALNVLLNFAQHWGQRAAMETLLTSMVEKYPEAAWAKQALEQLYFQRGDTAKLYQLYCAWLVRQPDNLALKNNATATALLLQTNLPQAIQRATELYAQRPQDPVITSTYAYALHLQNRDRDGLAAFQKLTPAELELPSVALYYGVLLRATGQSEQARPYLALAEKTPGLLPEEHKLLVNK